MKKAILIFSVLYLCLSSSCEKEEKTVPINISSVIQNVSVYGANDGSIVLTVEGGRQPYTYKWSNGAVTKDINSLAVGVYTVLVTGADGDTASHMASVTEPGELLVQYTKSNTNAPGANNGSISLNISGGVLPYTIACNSQTADSIISNLAAGSYNISVTDANKAKSDLVVIIADPLTLTIEATNASTFDANDGELNLSITGGVEPYSIEWAGGQTQNNLSGLPGGYYSVVVTDAEGIAKTKGITIFEPYDKVSEVADLLNKIERLSNAGVRIEYNSKIIYIDPISSGGYSGDADIILVTHSHGDHYNTNIITTLSNAGTLFAGPSTCEAGMSAINGAANYTQVEPGDSVNLAGIPINIVHAYNIVRSYHSTPTSVGYILSLGSRRIYHAGDTERIPEMTSYNADIALVPLGQTYTMVSIESAADAIRDTGAEVVIPIHYGSGAAEGKEQDPWQLKSILNGEVDVVTKPTKN